MKFHFIGATIRYLTTEEGGRQGPVASGYRGQFHYENDLEQAWDGFQYFPDFQEGQFVPLGNTVQATVVFRQEMWDAYHSKRVQVGMPFEIREGRKLVGRGTVTSLEADTTTT